MGFLREARREIILLGLISCLFLQIPYTTTTKPYMLLPSGVSILDYEDKLYLP